MFPRRPRDSDRPFDPDAELNDLAGEMLPPSDPKLVPLECQPFVSKYNLHIGTEILYTTFSGAKIKCTVTKFLFIDGWSRIYFRTLNPPNKEFDCTLQSIEADAKNNRITILK